MEVIPVVRCGRVQEEEGTKQDREHKEEIRPAASLVGEGSLRLVLFPGFQLLQVCVDLAKDAGFREEIRDARKLFFG